VYEIALRLVMYVRCSKRRLKDDIDRIEDLTAQHNAMPELNLTLRQPPEATPGSFGCALPAA
jgi:hypothetical protein